MKISRTEPSAGRRAADGVRRCWRRSDGGPNNVPNVPGHGGQDGLLAEGYVAKISTLILATYPEAALDARCETKIKTDIPKSQHVDFWCFGLILTNFGLILD